VPAQEDDTSPHPVNPFSKRHYLFWGFINLLPLAMAPAIRSSFFLLGSLFLFASTIKGYLYGVALPRPLKMVFHPLIVCMLYSSGCIALWSYLTNLPYLDVLEMYMPSVRALLYVLNQLLTLLSAVHVNAVAFAAQPCQVSAQWCKWRPHTSGCFIVHCCA
jgi:hypothetical protein